MIYKTAIIGLGRMGCTFDNDPLRKFIWTHAGAYQKVSKCKLIAAADIELEKQKMFIERWGVTVVYTDYKEMIKRESPDIVSICTQPDTHSEIAIFAANHGVKAIICEKPIASSLEEADKAIAACEANGCKLIVNHYKRRELCFNKAKKILSNNHIGKLQTIAGFYTNECLNTGTHLFDLLSYYGGPIDWLVASERDSGNPSDVGAGVFLKFKNGVHGHAIERGGKEFIFFEIDLMGNKGRLRVLQNGGCLEIWKPKKSTRYSEFDELALVETIKIQEDSWMVAAIEDAVQCIEENRDSKLANGYDGRATLEVIAAIKESSSRGHSPVTLPLTDRTRKLL